MIQNGLEPVLRLAPVVPVVIVESVAEAVPLARALVKGGLKAIEITLRTPAALDALRAVAAEVEGAVPGVGTVLTPAQYREAAAAGAKFAVSPGITPRLLDAAEEAGLAPLPGIATASEAMTLIERGYRFAKFFPAEAAGGVPFLASLASPLPQLQFCPTGGITPALAPRYLGLPNVICVGGSWMVKKAAIAAGDWDAITREAAAAAALQPSREG
ncbi:bifunctional 4-hydroxy-2-oxoglutarate aldolase/2-dehydro-3-deoxy-phosphogluconate aldolase [Acidocella sp.]|uniref:bifunctional 4-hydroxy-2-oxoglutarate aldolase/2-dehydro-3-deoxy-phosphogluconate aldolase n=1 Tax=Acidocella sp. TaxID=50710 RepID=UPI00261CC0E2|nr:bifunctional 4-hydroxy-2-oxoglutarate aldolase/2-dehydro-3-deoxy-phosphogluconate aldolase [Acidocella sp.]